MHKSTQAHTQTTLTHTTPTYTPTENRLGCWNFRHLLRIEVWIQCRQVRIPLEQGDIGPQVQT